MQNIYFATIEKCINTLNLQEDELIFCGQKVHLFNPILKKTIVIDDKAEAADNEINDWSVTFFKDSKFAQTFKLKVLKDELFKDSNEAKKIKDNSIAKIAIFMNMDAANSEIESLYYRNASWFLRGSETLTENDFDILPNEKRHIDGRGLALLYSTLDVKNPKRRILLLMLAVAYHEAFQQINENFAEALENPDNVIKIQDLYAEASIFNARYFFFNPIQLTKYPTYKCWQDFSDAYQLSIKYRETNEQLEQVHRILSYQKQEEDEISKREQLALRQEERHQLEQAKLEQQKNSDRLNFKIAGFGLLLSLFGIVEVIDTLIDWFK